MNAPEIQAELIKLLLKRLKECALESAAHRGVFETFTAEGRSRAEEHLKTFRRSPTLKKRVEDQFLDLDKLIEQVASGIQEEEFRKLLERFDPDGTVN
jgi:hypothetical protein